MYLVSACLAGVNCKYDGMSALNEDLKKMVADGQAIAICPELLAGMSVPREPCEIRTEKNSVVFVDKSGRNYTREYIDGSIKTLNICKTIGITKAILRSKSPSCGFGQVYDGTFTGKLIDGNGLTADTLRKNGIEVFNEFTWKKMRPNYSSPSDQPRSAQPVIG